MTGVCLVCLCRIRLQCVVLGSCFCSHPLCRTVCAISDYSDVDGHKYRSVVYNSTIELVRCVSLPVLRVWVFGEAAFR